MRLPSSRSALCSLLLVLATGIATGCKDKPAPEAPPVTDVPKTLDSAFAGASAENQAAAKAAVAAVQNDEQGAAIEALEKLTRQSDLTPEQRQAAAMASLALRQQIMEAAKKGDEGARQFLEQQRARK